jgi:hypothetical protein
MFSFLNLYKDAPIATVPYESSIIIEPKSNKILFAWSNNNEAFYSYFSSNRDEAHNCEMKQNNLNFACWWVHVVIQSRVGSLRSLNAQPSYLAFGNQTSVLDRAAVIFDCVANKQEFFTWLVPAVPSYPAWILPLFCIVVPREKTSAASTSNIKIIATKLTRYLNQEPPE